MPRKKKRVYLPPFQPKAHTPMHVRVSELHSHMKSPEIHASLLVVGKQLRHKKNGEPFLQLHLADGTGQVEANIWYNVLEADKAFESGHVLEVVGPVSTYQDHLQIKIEHLRRVSEAELNLADYPPGTTGKPDESASATASGYLEEGEWLGTDDSTQMAMRAQMKLDEIKRKWTQDGAVQPDAKPSPVPYNSAELRQKLAESRARIEQIRRKYGPHPPGSPSKEEDF